MAPQPIERPVARRSTIRNEIRTMAGTRALSLLSDTDLVEDVCGIRANPADPVCFRQIFW